jgi:hypothetical protein
MSKSISSLVFVLVSLLAVGCDDPEKAQDKCEGLTTTYCDRVVTCAVQADLLGADFTANDLRDECEMHLQNNAHCEDAVRVSKNFSECLDSSSAISCAVITTALSGSSDLDDRYIDPLPATCEGAVLYSD